MSRNLWLCALVMACVQVDSIELLAQNQDQDSTSKMMKLLGVEAPYVNVYRRNQTRRDPYKVYNAEFREYAGKQFLVGNNAPENHSQSLVYLLDDVRLLTLPNPNFKSELVAKPDPEPKKEEIKFDDMSLSKQVIELRSQYRNQLRKAATQRKYRSSKKKLIAGLKRRIEREEGELVELLKEESQLLAKEIEIHEAKLKELDLEALKLKVKFLAKRSEALVSGVHSEKME